MDTTDENYVITTNVNNKIAKDIGINETNLDEKNDWEPPKEAGLANCDFIIPSYYHLHKNPHKLFTIDYFEIIKDDIRNLRILNKYQMEYIKGLSHEYKNELFDIFNECIATINDIL